MRQHEKHAQGEFRRELGVIVYNFDKKEQVLRGSFLLGRWSTPKSMHGRLVFFLGVSNNIVLFRSHGMQAETLVDGPFLP